jgi:hypothetical protein
MTMRDQFAASALQGLLACAETEAEKQRDAALALIQKINAAMVSAGVSVSYLDDEAAKSEASDEAAGRTMFGKSA